MTHYWYFKKWLPGRKGEPCRVLARGNGRGPRNVLVEFEDGFRAVGTRFCVRRRKDIDLNGELRAKIRSALHSLCLHPQMLESQIHGAIAAALDKRGIGYEHEHVLGPRARVDFLCAGGIAIEVKKGKPGSKALEAQAARYADFESVTCIFLVVERSVFEAPVEVNGKPVHYIALSKNWGVAV